MGFVEIDAQMVELYLSLRPSERQGTLNGCRSPIFIREIQDLFTALGDYG